MTGGARWGSPGSLGPEKGHQWRRESAGWPSEGGGEGRQWISGATELWQWAVSSLLIPEHGEWRGGRMSIRWPDNSRGGHPTPLHRAHLGMRFKELLLEGALVGNNHCLFPASCAITDIWILFCALPASFALLALPCSPCLPGLAMRKFTVTQFWFRLHCSPSDTLSVMKTP